MAGIEKLERIELGDGRGAIQPKEARTLISLMNVGQAHQVLIPMKAIQGVLRYWDGAHPDFEEATVACLYRQKGVSALVAHIRHAARSREPVAIKGIVSARTDGTFSEVSMLRVRPMRSQGHRRFWLGTYRSSSLTVANAISIGLRARRRAAGRVGAPEPAMRPAASSLFWVDTLCGSRAQHGEEDLLDIGQEALANDWPV
ncbi:hypothetical protein A5906_01940 [Bradyrhizobium sacchari]|nr:hypothetical protein A5906_01940 [Bradyrhizobium sacchari]